MHMSIGWWVKGKEKFSGCYDRRFYGVEVDMLASGKITEISITNGR